MQGSQPEVTMQTRPWTVSEMIAQLDNQHNYVNDHIGKLWPKIDAYPVLLIFVPNCVPRLSFPAELQVMDGGNAVLQFRCPVPGHWLQLLALQPHKPKWVSVSKHIVQKQHFVCHGTISYPRVGVWIECQPRNEHCWSCNNWWQEPDTAVLQQAQLREIAPHELQRQARILQQAWNDSRWDNSGHAAELNITCESSGLLLPSYLLEQIWWTTLGRSSE
jgi:hypothetical protein